MNSSITELCRKNETTIRNAIARLGQARVAEITGFSESTISRFVTADIEKVAAILAAIAHQMTPADQPVIDAGLHRALAIVAMGTCKKIVDDSGWGALGS